MANDKQKLFRQKITEAVAEFGSFPQIASKGEVAKSTWHDVVNGKSLPNLEPTWRNMLAVLRTLPAERFHDVDWDMLYRGACREAGKEIPDDKPQPVHTAHTSGEAPSRLHLERGLASVHVFALPPVSRLEIVYRHLEKSDGRPMLLIGEGGLGKSVLLAELARHLGHNASGAVVLVPCARIPSHADLTTAQTADAALATAAGLPEAGLAAFARRLGETYGDVHVLVDTLDAVLTEDTAAALTDALEEIAGYSRLIVTCRTREYDDLIHDPLRGARFGDRHCDAVRMPVLRRAEILQWADHYVRSLDRSDHERERFVARLSDVVSAATVQQVCAVPLRLALACDLYSAEGVVPSDLTITGLYFAYWERRIARDRDGRRTAAAALREEAALALARALLAGSTDRLALEEAATRLPSGVTPLLSEGVLQLQGGRVGFFHQTYAEFAIALLLARESLAAELEDLGSRLADHHSPFWAVARHLLQMPRTTDERFTELRAVVPLLTSEGAHVQVLAALARDEPGTLLDLAARIGKHDPALLKSLLPLLGDARESCAEAALEISVPLLEEIEGKVVKLAAETVGSLLARTNSPLRAHQLMATLETVLRRRREAEHGLPHITWVPLPRALISATLSNGPDPLVEQGLLDRYADLGVLGQEEILRTFLRRARAGTDVPPEQWRTLAAAALATELPDGLSEPEEAELLSHFWESAEVRYDQGWERWQDVLGADLPARWPRAQIRFVADLADDPAVRTALLDDLLHDVSTIRRELLLNVARFVADRDPVSFVASLPALPREPSRAMVGFIAKLATQCAKDLERPSRAELIATLVAAEPVEPRKVWPAVIQLAGDDLDAHADLLDRFTGLDRIRGDTWEAARNSALKTWFDTAPLEFLRQHAATLHASLPATQKNARTRATLDGRLALFDDQARTSLHQTVVRGSAVLTASEATRSLSRSAAELDVVLDVAGARWFLDLLATPHTGAATELARALCDETRLPDPVLTLVTSSGGAVLVRQRLQQAVSSKRSTDLPATLVELLARMNRVASLPRDESRRVLDTVTGPVLRIAESSAVPLQATAQNDLATNFACWVTTVTRLALHSLPAAEVAASVRLVLSGWDPRQIGNRVERDVVTLLIAVLHHHPQFADWLVTELWPASGPGTKRAIAEAFAVHERRTPGHRALTLAQSPDCPPDLAHRIRTWLRH
ncbi:ATP-binding protein [Streptomyces sp. NPDC002131]|uniref:ATP-binding protein n=1 Tax=unclassified Streptomyces TaxID=2593676 RepID=UPI0013B79AF7|nr:ATP-binding protein [Streptomyces sp. SID14446]NEB33133.1 ATP-binding protein [Streptomyces sp. SID14446]